MIDDEEGVTYLMLNSTVLWFDTILFDICELLMALEAMKFVNICHTGQSHMRQ